jgi:hypothetical protein
MVTMLRHRAGEGKRFNRTLYACVFTGWHNAAVDTMELRLDPAFRRQYGMRAIGGLITALLLGAAGISADFVLATVFALVSAMSALFFGLRWAALARAVTRVSPSGIETCGLRTRRVAWEDVKEIRVYDFDRVGRVAVRGGFRGGSGGRNSSGGGKKVACVKIIRRKGRAVELAAPLVTRDTSDSDFDEKVRTLRSANAYYRGVGSKAAKTANAAR